MIDFGLRTDLGGEAKSLGWKDCGVVSGEGEALSGSISGKEGKKYSICATKKPEVARKNNADILALDFEDLIFDLVIAKNNEFVEFDLHSILFGENIQKALHCFQKALIICRKQKNKILVSTRAENRYQLRESKDVESFLRVMGMTQEEVAGISKNCDKLAEKL